MLSKLDRTHYVLFLANSSLANAISQSDGSILFCFFMFDIEFKIFTNIAKIQHFLMHLQLPKIFLPVFLLSMFFLDKKTKLWTFLQFY